MLLRLQIIIFFLFGGILSLNGQVVTANPVFPIASDAVVITFNADKGDMGLKDYSGNDIYAHTGVITDKSTSGTDWKYVIASWTTNLPKAKLTKVSANVYTLTISPSIREFYSVPSTETIKKLAFVFRNSTGTRTGRDVSGADIFYDVSETPVFEVMISQPDKYTSLINSGESITIQASASMGDSLILLQNNTRLKKVTELTSTYSLTATGTGLFKIVARAWSDLIMKEDSVFYFIKPPVTVEEVPQGLKSGLNVTGDNSAAFLLYAPGKNNVFVLADFNGWVFRDEGYMKRSSDGNWFWKEVTGLDPLTEYSFQYVVDDSIKITDPYSAKVLDPWNDKYITSITYPDLKAYPEVFAEGLVSVFRTRPPQYTWKNTSFTSPSKKDLVIYELLVRDFVAAHNFNTIRDSLAYFSRLGINAIEFMPVNEFDGNSSWGYNPAMYFAVDKYYGTADSFKELIDSCHSRGIAVILDIVLNHAYGNNLLVKMYFNSIDNKPSADNPWFNVDSPNPSYSWGYDFNHESTATQAFVDSVCHYWISEFKVDGFRFDFTKGFTNTTGDGWAYDQARINILKRMGDKIWSYKPDAHLILEHFAENSEEKILADHGFMLWGNAKNNYLEASMGYSSDLSMASYLNLGWSEPGLVTYMESHDEERMMYKNITWGNAGTGYDIKDFRIALNRVRLAATFFFTIPGPKMIWQFGELGYDISIDVNGRTGEKPIKWDYFTDTDRHRLYLFYKLLIDLRKTQPVFGSNNYTWSLSTPMKRLQLSDPTMKVNILGNFGVTSSTIDPSFQQTGKWYEYFTEDSITVTNVNNLLNLQPGEYRLYTSKKLPSPKLILGIEDQILPDKDSFVSVYPNPSGEEFNIKIQSANPTVVSVTIFDIAGRIIRNLKTDISGDIMQTIRWDGRSENGLEVSDGIYLVQVRTLHRTQTIKVIKIFK
ncbi:MAG: alpha-amylase family glycosyl hydrolase [Bacteroidales bacterium]|nr:alpha-amylase family glycosyl hydrolase [Bacteroidales bacterium]